MSRQLVESYLFVYASDRGPQGSDDYSGHGIVDVWNALKHVQWPPPALPGQTARILGVPEGRPGATCSYAVTTNLSSPPYSYVWWVNGILQPDDDEWLSHGAGGDHSTISVRVANTLGQAVWDDQAVAVSGSAAECLES